jgi:hypothetical protein
MPGRKALCGEENRDKVFREKIKSSLQGFFYVMLTVENCTFPFLKGKRSCSTLDVLNIK